MYISDHNQYEHCDTGHILLYVNKEFSVSVIIAGAVSGMIVSLIGIICARVFKPLSADETNDRLIAIIEEDFPAVKQLKKHNFSEYNHAISYRRLP
mgnify:CR=1 FL=1